MHSFRRARTAGEERDRPRRLGVGAGKRKAVHESSRERHGITREAVWTQPTPGDDVAVVYLKADDLPATFAGLGSSQDPVVS